MCAKLPSCEVAELKMILIPSLSDFKISIPSSLCPQHLYKPKVPLSIPEVKVVLGSFVPITEMASKCYLVNILLYPKPIPLIFRRE